MTTGSLRVLAGGFTFLEGPRWRDGRLYVSDLLGRRVHSVGEDGEASVLCDVAGRPSGLGFDPDGHLLIVSMQDGCLYRLRNGRLRQFADLRDHACGQPNDMLVTASGRAYVGTTGEGDSADTVSGRLLRVDPDGTVGVAADGLCFPNGAALIDGGRRLVVAETFARRLTSFDVAADGSLGGRRVWLDLAGAGLQPDGIAVDSEGAVWIADAHGSGAVRVDAGGRVVDTVGTGDLSVYAVALGGADGRTLFLCAVPSVRTHDPLEQPRGRLLAHRVAVPGATGGEPDSGPSPPGSGSS